MVGRLELKTECVQHELHATGAEVHVFNKRIPIYNWNKAEAAEHKYPCCIKLLYVVRNPHKLPNCK
jgi:hypothetical protein